MNNVEQKLREFDISRLIGIKIIIQPEAVNAKWRKPRIGKIVDTDYGTFRAGLTFFIKVDKADGLESVSARDFMQLLKNKTIQYN